MFCKQPPPKDRDSIRFRYLGCLLLLHHNLQLCLELAQSYGPILELAALLSAPEYINTRASD